MCFHAFQGLLYPEREKNSDGNSVILLPKDEFPPTSEQGVRFLTFSSPKRERRFRTVFNTQHQSECTAGLDTTLSPFASAGPKPRAPNNSFP